jgi:cytochrome c oxidase subunit 1
MGIHDHDGMGPLEPLPESWNTDERHFLNRFFLNANHKSIGLQYLWLAVLCVFVGMAMSLLMRAHLVWPNAGMNFLAGFDGMPQRYAALTLLHGSLMVFFVLTAAPQAGFGNYLLPLQIGASETAFPRVNLVALWLTFVAVTGVTACFFLHPAPGLQLWVSSVALFCLASLLVAINLSVTVIDLRAPGMTLPRLPVTVWAWFINAILSILIFSILLAACALLLVDSWFATHFFRATFFFNSPLAGAPYGNALSLAAWQRLFWFFAQAEVYVAILPCFGIVTHLLATFARRPVWKERAVVLALCAVGVFGFCIWGEHMFATGMNPGSPMMFSVLASSLGLPASILLLSWLGTLWGARLQWNTATLFVVGFISLFLSGCFSGLLLSRSDLLALANGGDFVSGHFHLVMGVTATFAILAALFFWFPIFFARRLNEPLGKLHFWLTFAGVYCVFMPMHWMGLTGQFRPSGTAAAAAGQLSGISVFITVAALLTVAGQGIFLLNLLTTLWRGEVVEESNPWRATTLEWMDRAPVILADPIEDPIFENIFLRRSDLEADSADAVRVFRGAYNFDESGGLDDFIPQYVAPERVGRKHTTSL